MLVREVVTDAKTGEVTERMVEMPDAITVEQGLILTAQQAQQDSNARSMEDQAATALANLRAYRDLSSPTNAQTTAAVKLLCRVAIGLIRLRLAKFDATD